MSEAPSQPITAPESPRSASPRRRRRRLVVLVVLTAHAIGFVSSIQALLSARTAPGAVAWIISLNTLPYVAVPAYWVLGNSRFNGYALARQDEDSELGRALGAKTRAVEAHRETMDTERGGLRALERLGDLPFLGDNRVALLIDGKRTFDSILAGIDAAERYVLVQSYIVKDDELGRRLKDHLVARATAGVRVHFSYDEFGSRSLPRRYVDELRAAGVRVTAFHSRRGTGNRFQINFRNHRKIVVVDGHRGWVGGHNISVDSLGAEAGLAPFRDTHLALEGPAVLGLQLAFLEDWHWATDEVLDLGWVPHAADGSDVPVLILPSGPADPFETASLMMQEVLHSAKRRAWIASPYFVPDEGVMGALKLAALRGVDVRVLIPSQTNDPLVQLAQYAFLDSLLTAGVRVHRYEAGFLHQKAFLIDDDLVGVGTVNLDNRSFRLNFEVTAIVVDTALAASVDTMLTRDFDAARPMTRAEIEARSFWFRVGSRAAYLTAPIL